MTCPYCNSVYYSSEAAVKASSTSQEEKDAEPPEQPNSVDIVEHALTPSLSIPEPLEGKPNIKEQAQLIKGNKLANASLFLALLSIFIPFIALVFAVISINTAKRAKKKLSPYDKGFGKAKTARVISGLVITGYLLFFVFALISYFLSQYQYDSNYSMGTYLTNSLDTLLTDSSGTYSSDSHFVETPIVDTQLIKDADAVRNYKCKDLDYVELYIGAEAEVGSLSINLREQPEIPKDPKQNIVGYLTPGDTVKIIGGPKCAEGGTWWKVEDNKNGKIGWAREYHDIHGYLILLID